MLEEAEARVEAQRSASHRTRIKHQQIDADLRGPHLPLAHLQNPAAEGLRRRVWEPKPKHKPTKVAACAAAVAQGELEWEIAGISWLVNTLQQVNANCARSCKFVVNGETFQLSYNPSAESMVAYGNDDDAWLDSDDEVASPTVAAHRHCCADHCCTILMPASSLQLQPNVV